MSGNDQLKCTNSVKTSDMAQSPEKMQWKFATPAGPVFIVASHRSIHGVYWKKQPISFVRELDSQKPTARLIQRCMKQLNEYFFRDRKKFDLPIELEGTDFQKSVWQELQRIPYGETCSYAELAKRIRRPKAFRAAGTANGKNPISIIIPCHRVIATNGGLGGYAGGIAAKEILLRVEGTQAAK